MRKLYLISYYFAPLGRADGVNRAYLVKYLAEAGWDIEVVSCDNPHGFIRSFQKDPSLLKVIPTTVKLHQIRSTYWGPLGGIAELLGIIGDSFSNWIRPVLKATNAIIKEPGVIYAIVPPITNARIAAHIARQNDLPLLIDFRDNVFNLDPKTVQQAATIIASTHLSLEEMRKRYQISARKGIVIYNGYATDHFPEIAPKHPESHDLKIVYAGLLNMEQDPAMLAKAIHYMEQKYPQTKAKVFVDYYGPDNFYTRLFLRKYLSERIKFRGYVPFHKALAAIAQADLGYTSLSNKRKAYSIPSKVFQYIAMETPILAAGPGGALQTFISEHHLGRYASCDDIQAQAEDIYFFLQYNQALPQLIENIRLLKPQFSMQTQVDKLSEHLASLWKFKHVTRTNSKN